MSDLDDLLDYIFDGKKAALYRDLETWTRSSRRFRAFATTYRGKIRAKLNNVRDQQGMKDLRSELETAALLLRDERIAVEYEKYAASKQRGPDLTVTFKTHILFNVEVRRIRNIDWDDRDVEARRRTLIGVLCDKVGQMPPGMVNLLWLVVEHEISEAELTSAATILRQLAEHKAEDFFTHLGFESATDFLKQYRRLSGVVLRQPGDNAMWLNPLAQCKVPPEIVTAIRRLGAA